MPHTIKKHSSKRRIVLSVLLVIVLVAGCAYAWHRHRDNQAAATSEHSIPPENTVSHTPAPAADNNANNARKASSAPADTLTNGSSASQTASFSVEIVNASASSGSLHVGNQVIGVTSGSCSLTATKGNQTLQLATSSVVQDVNVYDCGTFSTVSTSKFPTSGRWTLTLTVTNNGSSASGSAPITI